MHPRVPQERQDQPEPERAQTGAKHPNGDSGELQDTRLASPAWGWMLFTHTPTSSIHGYTTVEMRWRRAGLRIQTEGLSPSLPPTCSVLAGQVQIHPALPNDATLAKPTRPGKRKVRVGRKIFASGSPGQMGAANGTQEPTSFWSDQGARASCPHWPMRRERLGRWRPSFRIPWAGGRDAHSP
jgi:hypothetical protein